MVALKVGISECVIDLDSVNSEPGAKSGIPLIVSGPDCKHLSYTVLNTSVKADLAVPGFYQIGGE